MIRVDETQSEKGIHPMQKNGSEVSSFIQRLKEKLIPYYALPHAPGGHDVWHVQRVAQFGTKIRDRCRLDFDLDEFEVAAWLHNIDRVEPFLSDIKCLRNEGIQEVKALAIVASRFFYEGKPFAPREIARIVDAVAQHSKKDDEPGDSHLLTALRIADKLDRLNPVGFLTTVVAFGIDLPVCDPECPFGSGSTVEVRMRSVYDNFLRTFEWVPMLPSDEARSMIVKEDLRACIDFLRAMGGQMAREHQVTNTAERDIKRALGLYYEFYAA